MTARKGRPVHHSERPSQQTIITNASVSQDSDSQGRDTASETRLRTPTGNTITVNLEQILWRWLQDMMTEAEPMYWLRRAKQLDGIGTPWGDEAAQACRNKAAVLRRRWDS